MARVREWSALAFAAAASACTAVEPTRPAQAPAPETRSTTVSVTPSLQPLVDVAIADLAQRLGIARADVSVTEARAVVWPDGSLGCPQPGMLYTQVLKEGVLIRLQAQGRSFAYHGGGSRAPFLCDSPDRRDPPPANDR